MYWRDKNSKNTIVEQATVENLYDTKPIQCLKLENSTTIQIQNIIEGGPNIGTTNIPSYSAEGKKSIAKQLNGAIKYGMTINGTCKSTDITFREKLREFFYMADVEYEYHKYGIFGFYHPTLTDFNLDPNTSRGYTIAMPSDAFVCNSPVNVIFWKFVLEWGGADRQ